MTAANPRTVAVIPARGGSKGLPGKNIRLLEGRPMIAWSIAAARESTVLDRCIVSTDDENIARVAREAGGDVPFLRPAHLADDVAKIEDVLIDVLDRIQEIFDYIVLLQPTSPLRTAADIDNGVRLCIESHAPACISLTTPAKTPYWMYRLGHQGKLRPVMTDALGSRRQELPPVYVLNGALYVAQVEWFRANRSFMSPETIGYIMPPERSIDIDTLIDFKMAEVLANGA